MQGLAGLIAETPQYFTQSSTLNLSFDWGGAPKHLNLKEYLMKALDRENLDYEITHFKKNSQSDTQRFEITVAVKGQVDTKKLAKMTVDERVDELAYNAEALASAIDDIFYASAYLPRFGISQTILPKAWELQGQFCSNTNTEAHLQFGKNNIDNQQFKAFATGYASSHDGLVEEYRKSGYKIDYRPSSIPDEKFSNLTDILLKAELDSSVR